MKLKTVRVRRSRPSTLALALALMLTMLCVYLASLSARPEPEADAAAASAAGSGEVRMDGLQVAFDCDGRYATPMEARIMAAHCAQTGGAGLVLPDGDQYAVVRGIAGADGENTLRQQAAGLTLQMEGMADEIAAVSDAAAFLRALATETGTLADSLESGDADAQTLQSLLDIYATRGKRIQIALNGIPEADPVLLRLRQNMDSALRLLQDSQAPAPSQARRIHAAACADWIAMLNEFHGLSGA